MAKRVSTTPKKPQAPEPERETTIFEALGLPPEPTDRTQPVADKATSGPSTDDLLKQITELNERIARAEQANLALTQVQPTSTSVVAAPPVFSTEGLPDPIVDAEGYGRELQRRITKNLQDMQDYQRQQQQLQQSNSDRYVQLWDDFSEAYPELSDDPDTVELVTASIVKKAVRRGIDPERYMFGNRTQFMADVAKEYNKIFGPRDTDQDEDGPEPAPRTRRQGAPEDDGDTGRTEGIFGGDERGGRTAPKSGPKSDMIKDIQDMQLRTGFW